MPRYANEDRQRAEDERHRREILEAAATVLTEKGLHAATIRDVAKTAQFSVGKIYLHFPNKSVLFEELLDDYVDRALEIVEGGFSAPGDVAERLEGVVRAVLAFTHENPLLIRLLVNETLGFELRFETQLGKTFMAKYRRMVDAAVRAFEAGLERGELRGGSAGELALKMAGIFNAVVAAEFLRGASRPVDEVAEVILRLFWEGARGGAR